MSLRNYTDKYKHTMFLKPGVVMCIFILMNDTKPSKAKYLTPQSKSDDRWSHLNTNYFVSVVCNKEMVIHKRMDRKRTGYDFNN